MPTVLVINGNNDGKWFTVNRDQPLLLGRDPDLRAALEDERVSRQHCQIVWDMVKGAYVLTDLNSRNGVRVNKRKLRQPRPLSDDDVIHVGNTFMVFTTEDIVEPADAETYLEQARVRHSKYLVRLDIHEKKKSGDPLYANASNRSRRSRRQEADKNSMWLGFLLNKSHEQEQEAQEESEQE